MGQEVQPMLDELAMAKIDLDAKKRAPSACEGRMGLFGCIEATAVMRVRRGY